MQIVIGIIFLIIAAPVILQIVALGWFLVTYFFEILVMPVVKLVGWLFVVAIVPTYQYLSFVMTPGIIVVGVVLAVAFVIALINAIATDIWQKLKRKRR
jgi:predicted outer membrane lipoprotein